MERKLIKFRKYNSNISIYGFGKRCLTPSINFFLQIKTIHELYVSDHESNYEFRLFRIL